MLKKCRSSQSRPTGLRDKVGMVVIVDKMASTPMPSVAIFWTNKQILFLFHKMLWECRSLDCCWPQNPRASYWCYRTVNVERRKYLVQLVIESFHLKSTRFLGFLHQVSPISFLCKYVVYMYYRWLIPNMNLFGQIVCQIFKIMLAMF